MARDHGTVEGLESQGTRGPRRRPRGVTGPAQRNAARVPRQPAGSTRESRGPETSHYLEDDTFSVGRIDRPKAGDDGQPKESARRPRSRVPNDFDDDLVR